MVRSQEPVFQVEFWIPGFPLRRDPHTTILRCFQSTAVAYTRHPRRTAERKPPTERRFRPPPAPPSDTLSAPEALPAVNRHTADQLFVWLIIIIIIIIIVYC